MKTLRTVLAQILAILFGPVSAFAFTGPTSTLYLINGGPDLVEHRSHGGIAGILQ